MSSDVIDLGEDDGLITIRAPGGMEKKIDLWELNAVIAQHHKEQENRPETEFWPGVIEIMKRYGLPPVSQRVAARFLRKVNDAVEQALFRDGGGRESPGSTGPAPAA